MFCTASYILLLVAGADARNHFITFVVVIATIDYFIVFVVDATSRDQYSFALIPL